MRKNASEQRAYHAALMRRLRARKRQSWRLFVKRPNRSIELADCLSLDDPTVQRLAGMA